MNLKVIDGSGGARSIPRGGAGAVENGDGGGHDGGMDDTWRTSVDTRLTGMEKDMHGVKSAMEWMRVAFAMLGTFTVAAAVLVTTLLLNVSGKVEGLSGKITDEFRSQRAEMSAQTSAIANAITATKQQAPQVLLVPTPMPMPMPTPSPSPTP